MSVREFEWRIGERTESCRIEVSKGTGIFHFSGTAIPFRLIDREHIEIDGRRHRFHVLRSGGACTVWLDGQTYHLKRAGKTVEQQTSHDTTSEIRALMPGKLIRFTVDVGDSVTEKQTVAVMESMKMESPLTSPKAGRVSEIRFKAGDVLDMGETVMVIAD